MIDPDKFFVDAICPHCKFGERHAITVTRKALGTAISAVCQHCGLARAGNVLMEGANNQQNLLLNIARTLREGSLKEIINRDSVSAVPPVEDGEKK